LTEYNVYLKTARGIMPIVADKFCCEQNGYTVFYARPGPGEKFEEIATFSTKNVERIEET